MNDLVLLLATVGIIVLAADCVDGYRCDQCGFFVPWDYLHKSIDYIKDYNFCPKCGADMRGEQDEMC